MAQSLPVHHTACQDLAPGWHRIFRHPIPGQEFPTKQDCDPSCQEGIPPGHSSALLCLSPLLCDAGPSRWSSSETTINTPLPSRSLLTELRPHGLSCSPCCQHPSSGREASSGITRQVLVHTVGGDTTSRTHVHFLSFASYRLTTENPKYPSCRVDFRRGYSPTWSQPTPLH